MTDSGSYTFDKPEEPKKQRVLFRFDNDEPHEIGTMDKGAEFSISLSEGGTIQFEKNGKTLTIYTEDI